MSGRSGAGVWAVLAVCAALIVAAMGWLTRGVLRAESERSLAESRARLEERIRLSLWRMDSLAATLTIGENQRVLLPHVATDTNPLVRLRFLIGPDGRLAVIGAAEAEALEGLERLLEEDEAAAFRQLSLAIRRDNLWQSNQILGTAPGKGGKVPDLTKNERAQRGKAFNYAVSNAGLSQQAAVPDPAAALEVSIGGFQPTWLAGEPFLLRQDPAAIEGVWLDRKAFRKRLLEEIEDLLPAADLEPSRPGGRDDAMSLASFPWRLLPGEAAVAGPLPQAVVASLGVGWLAVAVALLAGLALVRGVLRLSERRASFVSAVTHELRTPLTTFRLYSDLLASGAVADEEKRLAYFRTMRREADRLSHLVENVLAFSRIERRGGRARVSGVGTTGLLESMRGRLGERLAGAGLVLELRVEGDPVARADAAAVEHVLFNLIDNAAKYAAGSDPAVVTLAARKAGGRVEIEVADHGPGIRGVERGRIFRAFHKSAAEAADTKPGVGLGLALSRRLARGMGGDLECRPGAGGRFVLVLPGDR